MIDDAIARYHDLLQSDPALAAASQEALDAGLRDENLFFGDRPLCSVLRPHMITTGQYARVREACRLVIGATIKVGARLLADERLMEPLRLSPREQELARVDHGYDAVSAISRLDAFLAGDSLSFIEYNAETPAGGAYTDVLTSVFLRLPVVRRFLDAGGYTLQTFDTRAGLTDLLLRCYQSWRGQKTPGAPSIGIVDWAGLPTAYEHELYRRHFAGRGLPAVIVDPRELEYAGGALRHGDTTIDLVYKRVLVHELLARESEAPALLQAYADGAVCMVNSPRGKLFHKKAIFALLTDAAYQGDFTPEERAAVRRHVPWTPPSRTARSTCWNCCGHNRSASCSSPTTTTAAKAWSSAGRAARATGTAPSTRRYKVTTWRRSAWRWRAPSSPPSSTGDWSSASCPWTWTPSSSTAPPTASSRASPARRYSTSPPAAAQPSPRSSCTSK